MDLAAPHQGEHLGPVRHLAQDDPAHPRVVALDGLLLGSPGRLGLVEATRRLEHDPIALEGRHLHRPAADGRLGKAAPAPTMGGARHHLHRGQALEQQGLARRDRHAHPATGIALRIREPGQRLLAGPGRRTIHELHALEARQAVAIPKPAATWVEPEVEAVQNVLGGDRAAVVEHAARREVAVGVAGVVFGHEQAGVPPARGGPRASRPRPGRRGPRTRRRRRSGPPGDRDPRGDRARRGPGGPRSPGWRLRRGTEDSPAGEGRVVPSGAVAGSSSTPTGSPGWEPGPPQPQARPIASPIALPRASARLTDCPTHGV